MNREALFSRLTLRQVQCDQTQNPELKTRNPKPRTQNSTPYTSHFILFLLGFLFLTSCSNNTVFESYHKFDNLNWKRFDNQKFEFTIENTEVEYDVFINIRHIPEIPYKEMRINYTIYSPSGGMRSNDLTMDLYDNEKNKLSECLGDFCDFVYPIRQGLTFSEVGKVTFEIENKFPKVDMPGIMEVGLIVKKSE